MRWRRLFTEMSSIKNDKMPCSQQRALICPGEAVNRMPWLTDARKEHILRTAQTVKELFDRFKIQAEAADNAYIAAVYHDCAKGIEKELLKKYSQEAEGFEEYMPTLHAPLGACIARDIFGIENESILEAIRWHCTGKAGMTKAELLVYLADAIEPGRDYPGVEQYRIAAQKSLERAVGLYTLGSVRYMQNKWPINPYTLECLRFYSEYIDI